MARKKWTAVLCSLIWVSVVLAAGQVRADAPDAPDNPPLAGAAGLQAPVVSNEGFTLYQRREYRRAAEKFLQAYALDGDPNWLFNIAHCYERLGATTAAIEKYEAFLANSTAEDQVAQRGYIVVWQPTSSCAGAAAGGFDVAPGKSEMRNRPQCTTLS